MVNRCDFSMVRGDTYGFYMESIGDIGELSGLTMTARAQATDAVLFTVALTGEDLAGEETERGRRWKIEIAPEDTEGCAPGIYKYDVQLELTVDGKTQRVTPLVGGIRIVEDQTREAES